MAMDYQSLLSQAQQQYSGIMSGYQNALSRQQGAQAGIQKGYANLTRQVLGGIQGIDRSQRQAIADTYAHQTGAATQGLVNAGLGNTTVTSSVARGLSLDEQKAQIALSNQMAQLRAGYQANLGMAGLNYRNQAAQQNTALTGQQLGYQGGYQKDLLGAAMSGAGIQAQLEAARMRGGGYGGGGGGMRSPPAIGRDTAEDPEITLPGYGAAGGYSPNVNYNTLGRAFSQNSYSSANPWQSASPEEFSAPASGYTYDWSGA